MKKNKIKRIAAGLFSAAILAMSSITALAADTVDVNGSGSYANDTSVAVGYQDRDLFSNMKELVPGDDIDNQVTIANKSSRPVSIYMKAYSEFTSEDGITAVRDDSTASAEGKTFRGDVLDQIQMTLTLGDRILYVGSADGENPEAGYEAMTAGDYGIKLGDFAAGQQESLKISLHLPGPVFDNSFADKFDAVDWVFCVEGTTPPVDPVDPGPNPRPDGDGSNTNGVDRGDVTVIDDAGVPLADWTGESGDDNSNIIILDPDVPLANIPKLGDEAGISGYIFGIMLALLITCSALYMRKKYSRFDA